MQQLLIAITDILLKIAIVVVRFGYRLITYVTSSFILGSHLHSQVTVIPLGNLTSVVFLIVVRIATFITTW